MKARDEVNARYTLDTNWRSAPGMVESVNQLFSQTDNAFMFRQIPFPASEVSDEEPVAAFYDKRRKTACDGDVADEKRGRRGWRLSNLYG
jgi:ATP-dependent exoDNAse (exonuclease V) beta subunit